jgi:hypothetical protein
MADIIFSILFLIVGAHANVLYPNGNMLSMLNKSRHDRTNLQEDSEDRH